MLVSSNSEILPDLTVKSAVTPDFFLENLPESSVDNLLPEDPPLDNQCRQPEKQYSPPEKHYNPPDTADTMPEREDNLGLLPETDALSEVPEVPEMDVSIELPETDNNSLSTELSASNFYSRAS